MSVLSIICVIAGLFPFGGKTVSGKDWMQVTKIVYRYSDASVAPDHYRSYTVTVTKEEVEVVVKNYSETLLVRKYPETEANYHVFVSKLKAAGVKKVREKEVVASGCTSESLSLYKGDSEFFSAYQACGDGNLKLENGNLHDLITTHVVPRLDELVDSTR